jgi:tyrosyl-tRNA synthetase
MFALTCPLITKADGGKLGETEEGSKVWLDPPALRLINSTSSAEYLDEDAKSISGYLYSQEEVDEMVARHRQALTCVRSFKHWQWT